MSRAGRLVCLGLLLFSARAEARECHEISEIVGEQRCSHFGSWDVSRAPALVISLGPSVELNPLIGSRFSVSASNAHDSVALPGSAGRDYQDRGVAIAPFNLRVTVFPRRIFYLGIEASLGSFGFSSGAAHPTGVDAGIRISQSLTARALFGFDALDLGAFHVAAMIELHTRSYDAFFRRRANATK